LAQESALVRLLKGGRVPEDRQGAVLDMIAKRGKSADLAFVLERAIDPNGFSVGVRRKAFDALREAARLRSLRPDGELVALAKLVNDTALDPTCREHAVELAGLWKMAELTGSLENLALTSDSPALRIAAVNSLARLEARQSLDRLMRPESNKTTRWLAIAGLAQLDAKAAAQPAAEALAQSEESDMLSVLLSAFLNRQGGAEQLAGALEGQTLAADTAKRALRAIYTLGRADAPLVAVLGKFAGLNAEVAVPNEQELANLVAEIQRKGNLVNGEHVFRRADLNCIGCHAIGGAGGTVGPDLGSLGASSPPDFVVRSILLPDEAIKEAFHTLVVLTTDGQIYQGIVIDKDDQRIVLKQADNTLRSIPVAEVEDQREGGSLMPKGLTNLITHTEFVDLVRFLAELGKPGPYALRTTPGVQTWRVLRDVPEALATPLPRGAILPSTVAAAPSEQWSTLTALVGGDLPLDEARSIAKQNVVFLQAQLELTAPGALSFRFNNSESISVWIDGLQKSFEGETVTVNLECGAHTLTVRVEERTRATRTLSVAVEKPEGSKAEFTIIGSR
jgi:putative heme-binding domain-containing protein